MKRGGLLFLLVMVLSPWAAHAGTTPCATTGGAINSSVGNSTLSQCQMTPQGYYLTIYKLGVCKSDPSPHGSTTPDFSSCHILLDVAAGQYTQLAAGSSVALPGATLPAFGTYGYAVLVVSNQIGIKNTQTYSTQMYGSGNTTAGTTCWSMAGTVADQGSIPALVACGIAAAAAPGITISKMDDMEGSNGDPNGTNGDPGTPGTFDAEGCSPTWWCTVTGGKMSAKLATSSLTTAVLADFPANITRLIAVEQLNSPVRVTAKTSNLDVGFAVTNGSEQWITGSGAACDGTAATCKIQDYGAAPFTIRITAK